MKLRFDVKKEKKMQQNNLIFSLAARSSSPRLWAEQTEGSSWPLPEVGAADPPQRAKRSPASDTDAAICCAAGLMDGRLWGACFTAASCSWRREWPSVTAVNTLTHVQLQEATVEKQRQKTIYSDLTLQDPDIEIKNENKATWICSRTLKIKLFSDYFFFVFLRFYKNVILNIKFFYILNKYCTQNYVSSSVSMIKPRVKVSFFKV